jgi:hypothetical protein
MITLETLKETVPSIFTTQASPKMSNQYVFVPTMDIMENFQREGWELSKARQVGKGIYGVHELRFRNGELPKVGDTLVEAIIRNSHNGLTTFSVSAGLHRLVCSNGLTVPTSLAEKFNIRHTNFNLDEVKKLTESFAGRLPKIQTSVERMMSRDLTINEKIKFVEKAIDVRWKKGSVPSSIKMESLLVPEREEDNGDSLWKVFNVVQEKFVRGGVSYRTNNGKNTKLRGLNNIMAINEVNTKLWELAEEII